MDALFLLTLAKTYAAHRNLKLATVATYAANDGKFFKSLEAGGSCTLDDLEAPVSPSVEAKVVKPTFGKPTGAKAAAARRAGAGGDEGIAETQAGIIADLDARRTAKPATEEPSREKFRRALEIEKRLTVGGDVTPEQQRWLSVYQTSSEYRSERALWEDFGDAIFG